MATLWFMIVAVMVVMYVLLDGFDIGAERLPERLEPFHRLRRGAIGRGEDAPAIDKQFREAGVRTRLLGAGHRFCFLFTDLANPTSNGIYIRIGYVPVADVEEWSFGV